MVLSVVEGFPRHFGRFLLLTSFGRGGMGEVFLSKQRVGTASRLCVVKTLRGDLADSREYVGRFNDEARVVVQLSHAHISQVYEAGVVGTDHFLAMEFIHGLNLKELLADLERQQQRLDPGLALFIVATTLDALAYAHRLRSPTTGEPLRVVHRDVSPANVMVSFEGDVKLIDFGLAESALKTEHTETRLVMGKVAYMSPEQARGDDVDPGCDQFAAAVMLYEAVAGDRFYGDMNTHQIWQIVGHGGHVPRKWLNVPEQLRAVLARALDKDPKKRFANCDEFRDAVDDVRASLWPRSNKAQLRELLTVLYGRRVEAERAVISQFALLEPPSESVEFDGRTMPRTEPAIAGTEPHLTSPSRPFGDPTGPGFTRGAPVPQSPPSEVTASVLRQNVEMREGFTDPRRPIVVPPVEPSASIAAPQNTAARAVGGLAAAVVALGAVFAIVSANEEPPAVVVDAGVVAAVVPVAPVVVDAGVVAVVADAGAVDVVVTEQPIDPVKPTKPTEKPPKPVEKIVDKIVPVEPPPKVDPPTEKVIDKVVEPVVEKVPENTDGDVLPSRSLDESLAIVRGCDKPGAKRLLELLQQHPEKKEAPKTIALIHRTANGCVAK